MPKKLDQDTLKELVELIIPNEHKPNKELKAGQALLGVYLISKEKAEENGWDEDVVAGILDMGSLSRRAGIPDPELNNRYIIKVLEGVPYHLAGVALAHEVGHLVSLVERGDPSEKAAERWAAERILKLNLEVSEILKFLHYIGNL